MNRLYGDLEQMVYKEILVYGIDKYGLRYQTQTTTTFKKLVEEYWQHKLGD